MMLRLILFFALAAAALARPASAQEPVFAPDTLPPADTIPREAPLPRAAFIRALVVPGWGHFGMGEYRRGLVYAALQGTSWVMLGTTMNRLSDARADDRTLTVVARDSVFGAMAADTAVARRLSDPVAFEEAVAQHPDLAGVRALVLARERHRQDWIVYTVVFTFAAAIDAYVTAHLRDFPVEVSAAPTRGGGMVLGLRLPLGAQR
jgi:hypothetical protein